MPRRINDAGLALVKKFEGLLLDAYRCPAGVWTIGYGHTGPRLGVGSAGQANPEPVSRGDTITQEQAEKLLRDDLAIAEAAVERLVDVPISDNQFAALTSLCFNIGLGALARSTLLRQLNAGHVVAAADEFPKWRLANGRVLTGLVRRRAAERALFLTPDTEGD